MVSVKLGEIKIKTASLNVHNGSFIFVAIFGVGDRKNIGIDANRVEIVGLFIASVALLDR
ncbi:MAG: hypothetical protein AAGF83_19220 [Cyanobacteria bacterium P01_G01_bin.67]